MTTMPFQINEVTHLYNRMSKLKPFSILERENTEPQDIVNISPEAKKRQVFEMTKNEVLDKIREAS